MSKEDEFVWWNGQKYLRHLDEWRKVVTPTTPEQVKGFRKHIFEWHGYLVEEFSSEKGLTKKLPIKAKVISDSDKETEFENKNLTQLWKQVEKHLLNPDSKWLEFTFFLPNLQFDKLAGADEFSEFRIENPTQNTAKFRRDSDGTRNLISSSFPAAVFKGFPPTPSIKQYLEGLQSQFVRPAEKQYYDSHYSIEELKSKGVVSHKSWGKHIKETWGEKKFFAEATNKKGEVFRYEGSNEKDVNERLLDKLTSPQGKELKWSCGIIPREIRTDYHPTFHAQLDIAAGVLNALDLVKEKGEDSPEARAFEMGLALGNALADYSLISKAPEALKNPDLYAQKRGEQSHLPKKEKRKHLCAYFTEWASKNDDKGLSNHRLLKAFIGDDKSLQKLLDIGEDKKGRIKHSNDREGYSQDNFAKNILGKLRPSRANKQPPPGTSQ